MQTNNSFIANKHKEKERKENRKRKKREKIEKKQTTCIAAKSPFTVHRVINVLPLNVSDNTRVLTADVAVAVCELDGPGTCLE